MNLRKLQSEKSLFALFCSVLGILLCLSLLNATARQRLLSLRSSRFGPSDESRLVFIFLAFAISSVLAYLILTQNRKLIEFDKYAQYTKNLPALAFGVSILIPSFFSYFQGKPMFTDFQYTMNFLTDTSVKKVTDNDLIYPASFLWLRFLPVPYQDRYFQLILLLAGAALFVWCISDYAKKLNLFQLIVFSILLTSSPIRWLFQSQNIDLFIVSTLYICALLYKDRLSSLNSLVLLFLSFLSLLKIYSLPILVFLLFTSRVRAVRVQIICLLVLLIPILVFDASKILGVIPLDPSNNSVGLRVVLYFLGFSESNFSSLVILLLLLGFLFILSMNIRTHISESSSGSRLNFVLIFNSIVFTSCFLATSNYPFRMVYLLFVIPTFLQLDYSDIYRIVASYSVIAFVAVKGSLGIIMNLFLLPIIVFSFHSLVKLALQRFFSYLHAPRS